MGFVCFVAFVVVFVFGGISNGMREREWKMMSAPWTPFEQNAERKISLEPIDSQIKFHKENKVTHVWAIGGMGQWSSLSTQERKSLGEAYVKAGRENEIEMLILHVGHSSLQVARELAQHALSIGAPAIAIIPPFGAERPSTLDSLVMCLSYVTQNIPLPMYYYHIPGQTGVNFKMKDLLQASQGIIPTFRGIKFVNNDLDDFYDCSLLKDANGSSYELFWAPDPTLQVLPFGASATVLAEAYYAPYVLSILHKWEDGDLKGALQAEQRLRGLKDLIPGNAGKYVMKMLGIDLGPPRLPKEPISQQEYDKVYIALENWGFFQSNKTVL